MRSCTACRRTSPSWSPGTATSTPPWDTRPSTPKKSSTATGHSSPAAGRCAPGQEYRTPTDAEWDEFLGHFERRRLALGDCGRAWGTSCIHEHSCIRCPLLRVDPAQRGRLEGIRDNLTARIGEAEREGWAGEAEGLKISLDAARQKLAQLARRAATVHLGMPGPADTAGRILTAPSRPGPPAEPS